MHHVKDGPRVITFEGEILADVSSRRGDASRWTEMTIYKTDAQTYVLAKIGRSTVVHSPGCSEIRGKIPRFQEAYPGDDPDVGFEYHECVPDEYDFTELLVEEDRCWALITSDPAMVIDALYRKRQGSRHMPRVSIDLLEAVGDKDEPLSNSWRFERIP